MTHFEAIVTILGIMIGWLSALVVGIWRARGWMDRRSSAERELARAVRELTKSQESMHRANQERFASIERRLDAPPPGRPYAWPAGR